MTSSLETLLSVMARLRDPATGCPWDIEQTFRSIAPCTIEEAYEVADAIERGNLKALKEELGDLLLQVVFHAQMAKEDGAFTFEDVAAAITDKLISRHSHIFGEHTAETAADVTALWETNKAAERAGKAKREGRAASVLDDIALGLPALMRALKIQKRMARIGFDWNRIESVLDKLDEEAAELKAEIAAGNTALVREEFGDLLFVMVNLARHLDVDPETALRDANAKVERRFRFLEQRLTATGTAPENASLETMENLWQEAKRLEKQPVD